MKRYGIKTLSWSFAIALIGFVLTPESVEGQQSGAEDVKTAIRTAWNAYIDAFSAGRTDLAVSAVYADPSYQLGSTGATLRMTVGDVEAAFEAIHTSLDEERYDRSETDAATICVINGGTALLSAHYTRYRTDDTVLTTGASSYLFAKFSDDWRIVAIIANPSGKLIVCD